MAAVQPELTFFPDQHSPQSVLVVWTLTATNEVGHPVTLHEFSDRTAQVTGTFDSAVVTLEGANIDTYSTLTDPQGNAFSKATASIDTLMEVPFYMRPSSSGGGVSQSVVVSVLCRRTRR